MFSLKDETKSFLVLTVQGKRSRKTDYILENCGNNYITRLFLKIVYKQALPKLASKLIACSIIIRDSKINGAELDLDLVLYNR